MRTTTKLILIFAPSLFALMAHGGILVLEGDIADKYVGHNTNGHGYEHAAIVIDDETGMIEQIATDPSEIARIKNLSGVKYISLKNSVTGEFDVIYPGLIDLHNHTKQNNLSVWKEARGQFANRFEWRAWGNYTKAVSDNMNPWIGYGKPINCAAFRWSELQAMVVGTTYLQGPSSCVTDYAIHQVEASHAFPQSAKESVQAPTDLIIPGDMVFVWQTLKPIIDTGKTYEDALAQVINEHCHADRLLGRPFQAADTLSSEGLDVLKDKEKLEAACVKKVPLDQLPRKFVRYVYWVHKSVAGKINYAHEIASGKGSAIIAHLAEGRRDDEYNQKEYELVQLIGMNRKGVNFVHAVGISEEGLRDMAAKQMGIIWSPFSNLILYNQTLDVKKALESGVMLALGSDWLPTGTKGPLEEMKVALDYIEDQNLSTALAAMPGAHSVYEALFMMATENAAKLINHWQGTSNDPWENGERKGGVGTIAPRAMGTLVITSKLDKNDPYKNIVAHVWEKDINLVVVDGKVQYGNEDYVQAVTPHYENISDNREFSMISLLERNDVPVLFDRNPKAKADEELQFLAELSAYITGQANAGQVNGTITCDFTSTKVFVHQNTVEGDKGLSEFQQASGLNLDRFQDIQRLLGVNITTQSRNLNDPERGDPDFAIGGDPDVASQDFTPLYTCNDSYHKNRVTELIRKTVPEDRKNRPAVFSNTPSRLAEQYQ